MHNSLVILLHRPFVANGHLYTYLRRRTKAPQKTCRRISRSSSEKRRVPVTSTCIHSQVDQHVKRQPGIQPRSASFITERKY
ncbi:hypothetical protein BDW75DRAFT_214078 [Aspergillus navahoensis]